MQALCRNRGPTAAFSPAEETRLLNTLYRAEMDIQGLMPWSSNYTFLAVLSGPDADSLMAVYKPCAGERPLWDFPGGNLCRREFASYLLSRVLGWPNIPPTVLRDGPHGEGAVQLFIEADFEAHYFTLREDRRFLSQFRQIALFDYIANNADRKGGHCLKDRHDRLWAIDHGLTFHAHFKLRTVIWDFCLEPIPPDLLEDLHHLHRLVESSGVFGEVMGRYISPREMEAMKERLTALLETRQFPDVHPGRSVPFPPV
ncbi:MAG: hypothetical protein D6784_15740 [Chloroflexi bacterium]|nr:MAG: hypothetical protein D6784_15740 [Chloroflexota bacterium]